MSGQGSENIGVAKSAQLLYYSKESYQEINTYIDYDNSIPQITEGSEVFSGSISPIYSDSVIVVEVSLNITPDTTGARTVIAALFKDNESDAVATMAKHMRNGSPRQITLRYMENSTGDSVDFSVRVGNEASNTDTTYIDAFSGGQIYMGGTWISSMTIWEVLPNA